MPSNLEDWFAKLFFKPLVMLTHGLQVNYSFDGRIVGVKSPLGRKVELNIDELDEIGIETTDRGPFVEDVFWALKQGPVKILVPQSHPIFGELTKRFGSLEGFDWRPMIEAMGCTDNHYFLCWKKPTQTDCNDRAPSTSSPS